MQDCDSLTALSAGRKLWILPPLEASHWSKRIDWYLGFQLRRARPHKRVEFSADLKELIGDFESQLPIIPSQDDAPLMVASAMQLPNHHTVLIPGADQTRAWVLQCHRVWLELGQPPARIFLPQGLSSADFQRHWPQTSEFSAESGEIELVLSSGPIS